MTAETAAQPRFLCDAMLGSLARWLRLCGCDTLYLGTEPEDAELARLADQEGRWLLTRDRELAGFGPRTQLVRSDSLEAQLAEVLDRHGLPPPDDLEAARCGECNGVLEPVARELVADVVPPYVLATAGRFRRCSGCGRVYWPGTHADEIHARLARVRQRMAVRGSMST
ncbi:MAG TPA: Mut7-C RNAse domain-containing protein [Methylomirabilota bacterium]|nr:Mut7-C RNAse domain-containing protein [Methylomirabilota bacterium]